MAVAIFFSYPLFGHVNYGFKLAREMVKEGDTVYYYSTELYKNLIESGNIHFKEYQGIEQADIAVKNTGTDGLSQLYELSYHQFSLMKKIMEKDFEEIKALKPEYIVYDSFAVWAHHIAKRLEVPVISSITSYAYSNEMIQKDIPFFIKNVLHMENEQVLEISNPIIFNKLMTRYAGLIAKQFDIKRHSLMDSFFSQESCNLIYTSRYLQRNEEVFDKRYHFVGPLINHEEIKEIKSNNKKRVLISLGTVFSDIKKMKFFNRCIDAFNESEYEVYISTGKSIQPSKLNRYSNNIVIKQFLPQLDILKNTDVFITHGGTNSVREALYFGVPLLLCPLGSDQFVVSDIMEELQLGKRFHIENISSKEIIKTIEAIINDNEMKERIKEAQASLINAGGIKNAVAIVKEFKSKNRLT